MSRMHQVVSEPSGGRVAVCDVQGGRHVVSLLAYDGPVPAIGEWVVAHSGFALCPADAEDVAVTLAEWRGAIDEEQT